MLNPGVQHLIDTRSPDGGWGPYAGSGSRTESTALATLALRANGESGAPVDGGRRWLEERQLASGAWPLGDEVPGPSWSTSLAALALSHFDEDAERATDAGRWLLGQEGRGSPWWARWFFRIFPGRRAVDLDADLIGWPWVSDTFSWVEPTAYAMIALKRLRGTLPTGRTRARLEEADRLLADRACDGGGWNYGNSRVLGEELWPYPDTTALALLALTDRPEAPEVDGGLEALGAMVEENDSILSLGLATLALTAHGRDASGPRTRLGRRLETWDGGEIRALAWAALALSDAPDPLGVRRG